MFYDELAPSAWSVAHQNAVTRFESLEGAWLVTTSCLNSPETEAQLYISEALGSNVEFFEDEDGSVCDSFGKAMFETKITGTGDLDLDNITFVMTTDLYAPDDRRGNLLEAYSEERASHNSATNASFHLTIVIDENSEMFAVKQTTLLPETSSEPNAAVTVAQRNECYITNWIRQ